jgi:hypothetical protein
MTADSGYIQCSFFGKPDVMDAFRRIVADTNRENLFSCGLSWLDDLDCFDEVESDSVSYDTISATRDFLVTLLTQLPELEFQGHLEHSWPVLPFRKTVAEFSANVGTLNWSESLVEQAEEFPFYEFESDDDEWAEVEIPLTPYD